MDRLPVQGGVATPRVSLWRNRNLLTLVGGQWVSQAGNSLFQMAVYWMVLHETGKRADLGFAGSILAVASVFGLLAGALVDRWDRRLTMIWVDVVRTVFAFGLVVTALAHHLPVWLLVAVVFVMALGAQLFYPAQNSLLPSVVPPAELTAANSVNQSAMATAQLIGTSLGGLVLGLLGPIVLFGFNGVSFGVSVISLWLMRVGASAPRRVESGGLAATARALWADVAQGQRTVWTSPFLRRVLPIIVVSNFAITPLSVLQVAWVLQDLHQSAFVYGLFGAATIVGVVVGSAGASLVARRLTLRGMLIIALLSEGLFVAALSRVPSALPDLVFLVGFGIVQGLINTMAGAWLQQAVPDAIRGRVFGTVATFSNLAMPLGGVLTGVAASFLPVGTIFAAAGGLLAASAMLGFGLPDQVPSIDIAAPS